MEKCNIFSKGFLLQKMWQDNQVKFDVPFSQMELRLGEYLIDKLELVEDTKGNAGDRGCLLVTNLRVMWHSISYPRINLSIGFNTLVTITIKIINTIYRSSTQALYILTSYKNCRYEFIFSNLDIRNSRHYTSVIGVHKAYMSSKIYREIKLRVGIIKDKQLILLPQEIIHETLPGVWNLSTEQGNIGIFIVTNIRIVWYAEMNQQFNVSIPYLTVANINIRSSKFGPTLIITSNETSGSYILGFKVDPIAKLNFLHKELTFLQVAYIKTPIFGIEYAFEHQSICQPHAITEKFTEFEPSEDEISNIFNIYFLEGGTNQRKPILTNNLGLATEEPREGNTLEMLWELLPSTTQ
ncbi:PREDICTED: Bardet-Biedl syndrome 5 protein homolog [Ceratosolen solmsi marchali]|uniref:Bardet-Biedl syndrome 5 protein homolog n=1 Tax=Ceratosolen solmsi marchali TaxID=326594 RepID=A0AAJ7DYE2_9HYME|nr:PREDICTED: Bardet-Biedl syndrome 5 protein homolog [Ceratosolen solmsi marchali]